MDIPSELSLSCQLAHKRYNDYLENKRRAAEKDEIGRTRKLLQEEYAEVKRKKGEEEEIVLDLQNSVDKYISQAAKEENNKKLREIIVKMNSFKETISKKKIVISELDTALSQLDIDISMVK